MARPRICLLFCGGTIGMVQDSKTGVLRPLQNLSDIIQYFPKIQKELQLDVKPVINIDSSNMNPKDWTTIAEKIYSLYNHYDGFVVAQGTDTMAYSASALSYALQNLSKPVVFTGALIPLGALGSDGGNNLIYACLLATMDIAEVCIVFANKILRGNRTKKYHESFVEVFHSPNFPNLGEIGRPVVLHDWRKKRRKRLLQFQPNFDPKISVLKLFPGFDEKIIDHVLNRGAKGIILEGFGPGNIPFLEHSLIPKIQKAAEHGIPIIIANQMEHGITNLNAYEGGFRARKAGAISSHDMTTEAVIGKLMWALANNKKISQIMNEDLAGEITIEKKA
ncbi:asparaginase [Candidatus Peregrinibacteria bacterium]|nr:asparaginase [Candidatus Peregrinibacteria bacterium]